MGVLVERKGKVVLDAPAPAVDIADSDEDKDNDNTLDVGREERERKRCFLAWAILEFCHLKSFKFARHVIFSRFFFWLPPMESHV